MSSAGLGVSRWAPTLAVLTASSVYVALNAANQWDFHTYYFAGAAARAGLNPYDPAVLSSLSGMPIELPFLYPPVALFLFSAVSLIPLNLASWAWLVLKVILAGTLVALWRRDFLSSVDSRTLVLISLLGYDMALLWDLRTGNVSLIEAVLLWSALSAYVRGRLLAFTTLVVAASVFKLAPLAFLLLLLLPEARRRGGVGLLLPALGVFAVLISVPLTLAGEWIGSLAWSLHGARPGADINPSALGVLDELLRAGGSGAAYANTLAGVLFLAYVGVVLGRSWPMLQRVGNASDTCDHVISFVILWLLLSPRVMVYTYVSAIVPTLLVIHTRIRPRSWRAAALLLLLVGGLVRLFPGPAPHGLGALSFALLLGTWVLWIRTPHTPGDCKDRSLKGAVRGFI